MDRLSQKFPTRLGHRSNGPELMSGEAAPTLTDGVFRFRLGRDSRPVPFTDEEISKELSDPFGRLILQQGRRPMSLRTLLAQLDESNDLPAGLPFQTVFLAADGGKIPWSQETNDLAREFRFAIARSATAGGQPDLMVSASTVIDDEENFLQVIGWDDTHHVYHYYQRLGTGWGWAGTSWDALEPDTRGRGPFDSHVNGSLVMKELKFPWMHWSSQASRITTDALAPADALRDEPLFLQVQGAEQLETNVVRPGIRRWNDARFARLTKAGTLKSAPDFLRQVLTTTSINLASTATESRRIASSEALMLPVTFFLDSDAFEQLGLELDLDPFAVTGDVYQQCLTSFGVHITDGNHRFDRDTHFAFVVPERAFEDQIVLRKLLSTGALSRRLAACLLMVDYSNPIFSPRRESLLRYVPPTISMGRGSSDLDDRFVAAVSATQAQPDSAEAEFMNWWLEGEENWESAVLQTLTRYVETVRRQLASLESFSPLFQLAESRRREFRRRPLFEFRLTLPVTNIADDAPLLEMTPAGTVQAKP